MQNRHFSFCVCIIFQKEKKVEKKKKIFRNSVIHTMYVRVYTKNNRHFEEKLFVSYTHSHADSLSLSNFFFSFFFFVTSVLQLQFVSKWPLCSSPLSILALPKFSKKKLIKKKLQTSCYPCTRKNFKLILAYFTSYCPKNDSCNRVRPIQIFH